MNAIKEFLKNRLKEHSTWMGLLMVAVSFGLKLSMEQQQAIIYLGMALAAAPDGNFGKIFAKKAPFDSAQGTPVEAPVLSGVEAKPVKTIKEIAHEDKHKAINDLLDSDSDSE